MANIKAAPRAEDYIDVDPEDDEEDADVEYLRRTTDKRHKVDYDPDELDFND